MRYCSVRSEVRRKTRCAPRLGITVGAVALSMVVLTGCAELVDLQAMRAMQAPAQSVVVVTADAQLRSVLPERGRLFLLVGQAPEMTPLQQLREDDGEAGDVWLFARDVESFEWFWPVLIEDSALGMPYERLSDLPDGAYWMQPYLFTGPGTVSFQRSEGLTGESVRVEVLGGQPVRARLQLDRTAPARELPPSSELVETIRWISPAFEELAGDEVQLEATVVLPHGYAEAPERRYPVRYHVGPLRSSHLRARELMADGQPFARQWLADGTPRMILVHLHSDGRFGDVYQVDSANNGPWGTAVARELVAEVDARYRTVPERWARFTDGVGAGGWAALSLLIRYPEVFGGAWALCPDSVDFRALQLVDLSQDRNAFVNEFRLERPSERAADGEPRMTLLNECWREQVLGSDDRMVASGGQWGSMNGAFSPRGADGLPRPVWDPVTGEIDAEVAQAWQQHDLRRQVVEQWPEIGSLLSGAIHIWASRHDRFYNGRAVELFAEALAELESPAPRASIVLDPWSTQCRPGIDQVELMAQMMARFEGRDGAWSPAAAGAGEGSAGSASTQ